ncbi:MAG: hypothetical protein AB2411_10525 [Mesobacillus sp.]
MILSREGAEQLLKEIQGNFEPVKA